MEEIIEELENPLDGLIDSAVVVTLPKDVLLYAKADQYLFYYKDLIKKAVRQRFPKANFEDYDFLVKSIHNNRSFVSLSILAVLKLDAVKRYEKAFSDYQRKLYEREEALKEKESVVTMPIDVLRDFVINNFPVIGDIDEENVLKFISGENYVFTPSSGAGTRNQ